MTPNILFLDDDTKRHSQFLARWNAAHYLTVDACLYWLGILPWRVVMLDHDMLGETYQPSDEETSGMQVVRFVESLKRPLVVENFVIHSRNEIAAPEMRDRLRTCGYRAIWVPFPDVISGHGDGTHVQQLLDEAGSHVNG